MTNAGTIAIIVGSTAAIIAAFYVVVSSENKPKVVVNTIEVPEEDKIQYESISKTDIGPKDEEIVYEFEPNSIQGGSSNGVKLVDIVRSNNKDKKWTAIFQYPDGRQKRTSFGANGMEDYTQHKDKERRQRYMERHQKDLQTNDPTRAGYLSYYILWGPSTNLQQNIRSFKRKFNL